ncbi:EamA family transporter [Salinispira pacifica]
MAILLAALSALLYGSADFAGGLATRTNSVRAVLVFSQIAGTLVALVAAPLVGPNGPTPVDLLWGAAAGLGGAVGLVSLYRGIASTLVAVVSPTAALIGAVVPVGFGLATGERPSLHAWIGIALCLPALLLLTATGTGAAHARTAARRALLYGLLAGAGFGGFFIAISRPSAEAGLWPLVAARSVSVGVVALTAVAARKRLSIEKRALATVLAAGILDMSANVAFVLAARGSMLSLVTIVTSLFPAPTVLLAWILFRERVPAFRIAGLALAIAGVALIGLG